MNPLFVRRPQLQQMLGIGRSTLYRWIAAKEFPAPVQLGPGVVAWRYADVQAWIDSRPQGVKS